MKTFYIENLSSPVVHEGEPWAWEPEIPCPPAALADKKFRSEWITNPNTKWCCYSCVEGVQPFARVNKGSGDGGNPPYYIHGFIGDYDIARPVEEVEKLARNLEIPPQWIERTFSGNWRFVWLFERPVQTPNFEFARTFLSVVAKSFDSILPNFDRRASTNPAQYFTVAGPDVWTQIDPQPVKETAIAGWVFQTAQELQKQKWRGFSDVELPLDLVADKLRARYPRFAEWTGEFCEGARGPTFWIEESKSPNSAIVTPFGMLTFSAHASKTFYSWADLFGHSEVAQWASVSLGRQVEGIYYDGRMYWIQMADENWRAFDKNDIAVYLKTQRGVSSRSDRSGVSPLERAIGFIQIQQRVDAAMPIVYRPTGLLQFNGRAVLNTTKIRVLEPAPAPATQWGSEGKFPWLSAFLDGLFAVHTDNGLQRDLFLAWLRHAYDGFYHLRPRQGHVLFLVGPAGVGKTLLNRRIVGTLFGGYAEAGPYLLGEDSFNSELFKVGLWCVDDTAASTDMARTRRWTAALKRTAANPTFRANEKFKVAELVEWTGRLIVTCNMDVESISMLPDESATIGDKLLLLSVSPPGVNFHDPFTLNQILSDELPYFARWLLEWTPPESVKRDPRFGIAAYAPEHLKRITRASASTTAYVEIISTWLSSQGFERWEGYACDLYRLITSEPGLSRAFGSLSYPHYKRLLESLAINGRCGAWEVHKMDLGDEEKWIFIRKPSRRAGS